MIHSMAGGVLGDLSVHTFAKVDVGGAPLWYLAPMRVTAGQKVVVPYGREGRRRTAPRRPRPFRSPARGAFSAFCPKKRRKSD